MDKNCYQVGQLDLRRGPSPSRDLLSFSDQIRTDNDETSAETGIVPAVFSGQRMERGTLVGKSTSQPNSGGATKYIGGSR